MENIKHTPGPWMAEPINSGETFQVTSSESTHFAIIAETYMGTATDEANARLIAAAPETLAERDQLRDLLTEMSGLLVVARNGGGDDNIRGANAILTPALLEVAAERDRLKDINAELLTALKELCERYDTFKGAHGKRVRFDNPPYSPWFKARAIIAKAEGV